MSANLSSVPKLQFFDNNGNPLVAGKLYTYEAGTTTPLATYTDSTATTPNTNPIILDSRGEANVWLSATQYKFELRTAADALIWTVDNISNALNLSQLLASSGSAANPPYTFAADPTTGMYLAAAGQIGLSANGTPVFRSTDTQAVLDANLQVSGTARRITGDFSNATIGSRVAFQSNTTNGNTSIPFIPNGTGTVSGVLLYGGSDTGNTNFLQVLSNGILNAGIAGTGTYQPLAFYTGGSERVTIDTSGNVGVGTSSPGSYGRLESVGAAAYGASLVAVSNSSGSDWARIDLKHQALANTAILYLDQAGEFAIRNDYNGPITFSTDGANERMRIDSSGNVGIGTTSPSDRLSVAAASGAVYAAINNGTVNTVLGVSAGNEGLLGTTTNQDLLFFANNAERARITAAGLFKFDSGYGSVATAYGCRAWINFDGTSGSIGAGRASGNVSSVTDNGTGDYTINFTTAMPDGNYCVSGSIKEFDSTAFSTLFLIGARQTIANTFNTDYIRVNSISVGGTLIDAVVVSVAVFR